MYINACDELILISGIIIKIRLRNHLYIYPKEIISWSKCFVPVWMGLAESNNYNKTEAFKPQEGS